MQFTLGMPFFRRFRQILQEPERVNSICFGFTEVMKSRNEKPNTTLFHSLMGNENQPHTDGALHIIDQNSSVSKRFFDIFVACAHHPLE